MQEYISRFNIAMDNIKSWEMLQSSSNFQHDFQCLNSSEPAFLLNKLSQISALAKLRDDIAIILGSEYVFTS